MRGQKKIINNLKHEVRRDTARALRSAGHPRGPRDRQTEDVTNAIEQNLKDEFEKMPKGPKGQKRPADVIGNAIKVARIATGEETDEKTDDGKDKAAVSLGQKGGKARARALSKTRRSEIAKQAAVKRWKADQR